MDIVRSAEVLILAGLCEISGGYLIWLWLRKDKPIWYGVAGALILVFMNIFATLQTSAFVRVYAALWRYFHCNVTPQLPIGLITQWPITPGALNKRLQNGLLLCKLNIFQYERLLPE